VYNKDMPTPIKPVVIDNIFSEDEIESIYNSVAKVFAKGLADHDDKYYYMTKLTNNGFIAILDPSNFNSEIKDKFTATAAKVIDNPRGVGFLFARYTLDSGSFPSLMPHCDKSEKKMGLYGTVELRKTLDWDFYVEDEKFDMAFNRSVWFTGTHQPHWRPDIEFGPNDYYDIVICQTVSLDDQYLLTEEDRDIMDSKAGETEQKYKHLFPKGLAKQYEVDGCQ
jgi:hypothetical protein